MFTGCTAHNTHAVYSVNQPVMTPGNRGTGLRFAAAKPFHNTECVSRPFSHQQTTDWCRNSLSSQVEIPNIQKQRKHLAKLVLDMDSARTRWACYCVWLFICVWERDFVVWETPSPVNRLVLRLPTECHLDLIAHSKVCLD